MTGIGWRASPRSSRRGRALAHGSQTYVWSDGNVYVDREDKGTDNVLYVLNARETLAVVSIVSSPGTCMRLP